MSEPDRRARIHGAGAADGAADGAPGTAHTLLLLTRAECELCEQMLSALEALRARAALPPVRLLEVDTDVELKRRYGLKIPVLLLDGTAVCSVRLDEAALLAALGPRTDRAPVARG